MTISDCLLVIFALERKRFLSGTGASAFFSGPMLIKMPLSRIPFSGAVPVFSFAVVARRMFRGSKRFRKGPLWVGPVRGEFFASWSSLRLTDQKINLFLQKNQLLLHPLKQGNNIHIGFVRCCGCVVAPFFLHLAGLPFVNSVIGPMRPEYSA
jgi:hypothetical protein